MHFLDKHPQKPGHEERQKQQRKHLTQYFQESCKKSNISMRFNPREYQRNNHRSQKIGQQCIRGKTRRTSAQLTGNDRSSSSRRTNKTYHSPFKNFPIHLLHRTAHQQSRHNQTRHRLKQQQPAMPSFRFQITRFYLTKG